MYAKINELPAPIIAALESVGYGRKDICVEARSTVALSGGGGDGIQCFVTLVNLTTGQHETRYGSWGGANMFNRDNPVDNDHGSYPLPANGVAIRGSRGGGRPVYATLLVPASMVDRMLPAPAVELTPTEREALVIFKSYKGGAYRRDALTRAGVTDETITSLVTRGFLTRNRAGATAITTDGKNVIDRAPAQP